MLLSFATTLEIPAQVYHSLNAKANQQSHGQDQRQCEAELSEVEG